MVHPRQGLESTNATTQMGYVENRNFRATAVFNNEKSHMRMQDLAYFGTLACTPCSVKCENVSHTDPRRRNVDNSPSSSAQMDICDSNVSVDNNSNGDGASSLKRPLRELNNILSCCFGLIFSAMAITI